MAPPPRVFRYGRAAFVVTNVVRDADEREARTVHRVHQLAVERGARHLAVSVRCDRDALLSRVTAPDRFTRHKWTDPEGVARYMEACQMMDLSAYDTLELDTTDQSPEASAALILDRLDAVTP